MRVAQTTWNNQKAYIASLRDITERKKIEDALRKSRKEWERTFDAFDDTITILDLDRKIVRTNDGIKDVFNKAPKELIGRPCHELFGIADGPCPGCPLEASVIDKDSYTAEITPLDSRKILRISIFPLLDEEETLIGAVHITRDVTEHKALGNQLRQAQKMESIGTLAGGIAHDFNNILSIIMGFTSLAIADSKELPALQEDLQEVYQATLRATELVRQILTFSRHSETDLKPLKIRLVINEALKLLRSVLPTTIDMKIELARGLPAVLADPTQIHQVIMNLCTNASHAMETTGGVLKITLNLVEMTRSTIKQFHNLVPGPYLELVVSDTGCGIPPECLDSIFDPYFTTKDLGEGTGLGLSVVHGIVKQYGGEIMVRSELGKGTRFCLYFPTVYTPEVNPLPVSEDKIPDGNGRILVVDDEAPITKIIDRILKSHGYEIVLKNNSTEALSVFQKDPDAFDLVITDMTMPKLTGDLLAKKIVELRPEIPVILMTGFSKQVPENGDLAEGISALIMKPISHSHLLKTVFSLMKKNK